MHPAQGLPDANVSDMLSGINRAVTGPKITSNASFE